MLLGAALCLMNGHADRAIQCLCFGAIVMGVGVLMAHGAVNDSAGGSSSETD